jgi:type 1 fimbria pilin
MKKEFVALLMLLILASSVAALADFFTEVKMVFQVEKAIVVEGEDEDSVCTIDFGNVYQGESASKEIKIINNLDKDIDVNISFYRAYKMDGGKIEKTKMKAETASRDWGITVRIFPEEIKIPANGSENVTIWLNVAQTAEAIDYEVAVLVKP